MAHYIRALAMSGNSMFRHPQLLPNIVLKDEDKTKS